MKTVAKINPELEYQNAKNIIDKFSNVSFDKESCNSLDNSVDKLITATRVLMEREDRRRGNKKPKQSKGSKKGKKKDRDPIVKLPSEKYPHLEIKEEKLTPEVLPKCKCCDSEMKESGLFDISEKIEVIPAYYYIQRHLRAKYNCGKCHGSMVNTPALPSIVPLSNYGDSLILDVTLSKYCDLIPMERIAAIAYRGGLIDLPANSLIELTHHLSGFLYDIYSMIRKEVQDSKLILADETPHKMLEGDDTKNWYLWGFFNQTACYYEAHNTRGSDVPTSFLYGAKNEFLLTDGYSGYKKTIKNIKNDKKIGRNIVEVYCNAHAYRYFKEASITWKDESTFYLEKYGEIYELESEVKKARTDNDKRDRRNKMSVLFEEMKAHCKQNLDQAMPHSGLFKAIKYFLNHYDGLTVCTEYITVPLDNNGSERSLRSPVVGRKTWIGTHSKRGAMTNAIHFSLIESCKVNGINPRQYYDWVVKQKLSGKNLLTPYQYSLLDR